MKRKAMILVMYDGPDDAPFQAWMDGPHYDEVRATPGIVAARRYRVADGPSGHRRYVAILESDDIDATLAWRNGGDGQRSQREANEHGVANRYSLVCELLFSTVPGEAG